MTYMADKAIEHINRLSDAELSDFIKQVVSNSPKPSLSENGSAMWMMGGVEDLWYEQERISRTTARTETFELMQPFEKELRFNLSQAITRFEFRPVRSEDDLDAA